MLFWTVFDKAFQSPVQIKAKPSRSIKVVSFFCLFFPSQIREPVVPMSLAAGRAPPSAYLYSGNVTARKTATRPRMKATVVGHLLIGCHREIGFILDLNKEKCNFLHLWNTLWFLMLRCSLMTPIVEMSQVFTTVNSFCSITTFLKSYFSFTLFSVISVLQYTNLKCHSIVVLLNLHLLSHAKKPLEFLYSCDL